MATVVDDTQASLLQGGAAQITNMAMQGTMYLMETTRLGHQANIDQRHAVALQEARTSAQSREVLQTQAALNAPRQTAPAYVPEASTGPVTKTS